MTEYLDDEFEDDDEFEEEDLHERLDAMEQQLEARVAEDAVNHSLRIFQRDHGRLDPSVLQAMGEAMDADGLSAEDAWGEVSGENFEATFDAALDRLEKTEVRCLLQREVDALWEASIDADDPEHIDRDKLVNLDRAEDRAAYRG